MDSDRQISTTEMWMWLAWTGAIGMAVLATIVGVCFGYTPRVRMLSIALFAHAFLILAGAVCATIKVFMRRQTRLLLDAMLLRGMTNGASVRQLNPH